LPELARILISLAPLPTSWVQASVPVLATAIVKEVPVPLARLFVPVATLTCTDDLEHGPVAVPD
jgi:hypothetical protein